jgi:hypothetical protein
MRDAFARLVRDCLAAIEREAPAASRALAERLGPTAIELVVDDELVFVEAGEGRLEVKDTASPWPRVHVRATGRALLDLVDGEDELVAAVLANRLRVRAAPRDASRLFDAMRLFVEGSARAPGAWAALARYRQGANGERSET